MMTGRAILGLGSRPQSCDHPHINYVSGKSFVALSGQFAVMRCSDDGSRIEAIVLSAEPDRWRGARLTQLRAARLAHDHPARRRHRVLGDDHRPVHRQFFAEWFPGEDKPSEGSAWGEKLRTIARKAATRVP
jgi:hypothetical protein